MANFCSDNTAGVSPEIMEALAAANTGAAMPYGNDDWTRRLETRLADLFEHEVAAFPVATGTAANALALATVAPPFGAIYCHRNAHIEEDECGAPELMTGGAKLATLPGDHGRIDAAALAAALDGAGTGVVHHVQPAAVSLTQATEAGTVYRPDEIAAIAEVAHGHSLTLHMDGARFANAMVRLACSPAEATWRAGVDVLCLGATKNGAMAAEVVMFFDPALAQTFGFRRKRAGHLFSKMRFVSAQLHAWLADDLWLRNAAHANRLATRLAEGLEPLPGAALLHPVEANEVFVTLPAPVLDALRADGFAFYPWGDAAASSIRLVVPFDMPETAVDRFLEVAADASRAAPAAE